MFSPLRNCFQNHVDSCVDGRQRICRVHRVESVEEKCLRVSVRSDVAVVKEARNYRERASRSDFLKVEVETVGAEDRRRANDRRLRVGATPMRIVDYLPPCQLLRRINRRIP